MSYGWNYVRPRALLDQTLRDAKQVVGGVEYHRRSIYAAPESWGHHIRNTLGDEFRTHSCSLIAHAHISDGCEQRRRDAAWSDVLGGDLPEDMYVYGKGWTAWSGYENHKDIMLGFIKPSEVTHVLQQSWFCPCVALAPGYYTGKPYVLEAQGCIPLLYGRGRQEYTFDPLEKLQALQSDYRIESPGDLKHLVGYLMQNDQERIDLRDNWRLACLPNWTVLDKMLRDLNGGMDPTSPEFFSYYGGYGLNHRT